MSKSSSSPTCDERGEYPQVTQADLDRATFRVGLEAVPRKQRITISLDTGLVEYFKAKAGERGDQTLINETLRQAIARDDLEDWLRRIIGSVTSRGQACAERCPGRDGRGCESAKTFAPGCAQWAGRAYRQCPQLVTLTIIRKELHREAV